jgi:hypothetical protein
VFLWSGEILMFRGSWGNNTMRFDQGTVKFVRKYEMKSRSSPILFIAATFLFLPGCATAPQHLSADNQQKIKNVAVVSLVPESVNFSKIMIVSSKDAEFNLGKQVTDAVYLVSRGRIAQSHPAWVVKDIKYDRAALLGKVESAAGVDASQAREAFADLARANDLDAIFVVRASKDKEDDMQQEYHKSYLREGMNVQLKDDYIGEDAKLFIRANLNITIIGRNGEIMAAGAVPAELDRSEPLDPGDYDVRSDMKHNLRPEVTSKLGGEVVADLSRRLNLCFDSLGFAGKPISEPETVKVVPQSVNEPSGTPAAQAAPSKADAFDQCFKRCRQYTDRTKGQCFDACNK